MASRKLVTITVSAVAAGSLSAAGLALSFAGAAAAAPHATTHTVTFKVHQLHEHQFGKSGRFVDVDREVRHGHYFGNDVLSGRFDPSAGVVRAHVALARAHGLIYAQFHSTQSTLSGKVTGGTGAYKGVTGTLTGTSLSNNVTKVTITYSK